MTDQPDRPEDPVQAQLDAYNARDVDAFVACYADPCTFVAVDGSTQVRTREQLAAAYTPLFRDNPALRAVVPHRIRVGQWVVDEEHVTGLTTGDELRAIGVFQVVDGLIVRSQFLQ